MKITETSFELSGSLATTEGDCLAWVDITLRLSEHDLGDFPEIKITVPVQYRHGDAISEIRLRARVAAIAALNAVHGQFSE